MTGIHWLSEHWFDIFQTVGIISGLLFTAHTVRKDGRAREITNSIAIKDQYRKIWKEMFDHPKLARVLEKTVDVINEPVSKQEEFFVNNLIQHLGTVYRATRFGEFVMLSGLQRDVREFFALPIPRAVWEQIKPFQDSDFVNFVETCRMDN